MFAGIEADEDLTTHGVAVRKISEAIRDLEYLATHVDEDTVDEIEEIIGNLETALAALEEM